VVMPHQGGEPRSFNYGTNVDVRQGIVHTPSYQFALEEYGLKIHLRSQVCVSGLKVLL
jgi:hypothetical protein